jgi:cobalt-zinc-cadmium efflux system outer membrane protein
LLPNPELETEIEEFGWDAPGFRESELTLALSQELELFGQRGARVDLARTDLAATQLSSQISSFDLYLEVKRRFYSLVHAEKALSLADASVSLAQGIVEEIAYRVEQGAALQSELMLARLELERAQLKRLDAGQTRSSAETRLSAMWGGIPAKLSVSASEEPVLANIVKLLPQLESSIDSSRTLLRIMSREQATAARLRLAAAESRPSIALRGGIKRSEAINSNSFLVGIGLPLPIFDRNQGKKESLGAQLRMLGHQKEQAQFETAAAIAAERESLKQLIKHHAALDSLLLPTADETYEATRAAFEAGRIPFTGLLDAERSLVQLRFEHNDILLLIHEQIMKLESIVGIVIRLDQER